MTFTDAEQYLYSLINLRKKEFTSDPRHAGLYLKRVQFFLDLIGNPEQRIPHYIHVTGTSGKGSVCRFLHSGIAASGKRTGMLTSPHASIITERWVINGKQMAKREFTEIVAWLKPLIEEYLRTTPYDMLSYAELMTVIGLQYFAMHRVDYAVIEVACGGRFDATNVIPHKEAAIITNIGLDHTNIWKTKKEIAIEKVGIVTHTQRVYTGEKQPLFRDLFAQEAKKRGASFTHVTHRSVRLIHEDLSGLTFYYQHQSYSIQAFGRFQMHNAALAATVLQDLGFDTYAIHTGLAHTVQPVRMEVISQKPIIILDSAHNVDKIRATVNTVHRLFATHHGSLHLLVGFCEDKALASIARQLRTLTPKRVVCTRQTCNIFRKVHDPRTIADQFPHTDTVLLLDPIEALRDARQHLKPHDILLITGSTFLAGQLRPYLTS